MDFHARQLRRFVEQDGKQDKLEHWTTPKPLIAHYKCYNTCNHITQDSIYPYGFSEKMYHYNVIAFLLFSLHYSWLKDFSLFRRCNLCLVDPSITLSLIILMSPKSPNNHSIVCLWSPTHCPVLFVCFYPISCHVIMYWRNRIFSFAPINAQEKSS